MNEDSALTNEHTQAAAETPSTAAEPATVAATEQPADQDAMSGMQRLIHKVVHELRHDLGHAITLIALHVVALAILDKTPLLALLTLH